jgi:hypothetical protein
MIFSIIWPQIALVTVLFFDGRQIVFPTFFYKMLYIHFDKGFFGFYVSTCSYCEIPTNLFWLQTENLNDNLAGKLW